MVAGRLSGGQRTGISAVNYHDLRDHSVNKRKAPEILWFQALLSVRLPYWTAATTRIIEAERRPRFPPRLSRTLQWRYRPMRHRAWSATGIRHTIASAFR